MRGQVRQIVHIDEELCDGCGDCLPHCEEGALKIVDGKAKLVADRLCDGLGACLGTCPKGAIQIIERAADEFSAEAVKEHLAPTKSPKLNVLSEKPSASSSGGCPGARMRSFEVPNATEGEDVASATSALSHWPVQLRLLSTQSPILDNASLLLAADCAPVACADFHSKLLTGRVVVLACPKLDDIGSSYEHLAAIVQQNNLKEIVVAHMEVPCCTGLIRLATQACEAAGKQIPIKTLEIGIKGSVTPD